MNTKTEVKLLAGYFSSLLIRNKFIIAIMIFNILFMTLFPLILLGANNVNAKFKELSIFVIGLPMLLLILFVTLSVTALFIKTKKNNIDLYTYIKPFKNNHIIWIKQIVIWIFSLHLIAGFILESFILGFMGVAAITVFVSMLGVVLSVIFMSIIWIIILSIFPIFLGFMQSLVAISIFSLIFVMGSILPIIAQQSSNIATDFDPTKYKNNLIKIYSLDKNNKVKKIDYAVYENPLGLKANDIKGWKPSAGTMYSPLNVIWGLAPLITSSNVSNKLTTKEILKSNNRFAVNYAQNSQHIISEELLNSNIFAAGFSEETIFDYDNKEELFSVINKELLLDKNIANNIDDPAYWKSTKNELLSRNIWTSVIAENTKNMLLHIMGLDSSTSILFNIFDRDELITNQLDGVYDYLSTHHSVAYAEFIKFIWTNKNVKLNVYSYQSLGNYTDLSKIHLVIKTYDEYEKADIYDIAFVKNKLFNIVADSNGKINSIQILNKLGVYSDLTNKNFFSTNVSTVDEFNLYIDNHSTINNLNDVINKASAYSPEEVYKMSFKNNVPNYLTINSQLTISEWSSFKMQWLYLIILIIIAVAGEILISKKVMKGDIL